ncbi:hypothetical protein PV08_00061 [Exophiala spinifera]|uniref:E3 ubiquitin-protein ligase listerin n=1 Tax=Exophiala spinifera TaxID=91928 RepID=A0A0D2C7H7_9EURO|nr:uncharacterized protein PV08_00061 [Exophiala spinifera]KIW19489.1 hypothetical protein PV08_00061 [Exophiala spinifera]
MSRKFKSQASSARAASAAFGSSSFGFAAPSAGFQTAPSSLSYIAEQPDLTAISDPHLLVAFRNLGKKDSTTKAKALEEIQDYVGTAASNNGGDAGLLEAWLSLYPRTSIDNSRRVRQLAHTIQGSITSLYGRRIAPSLQRVIGPWLSGVYDSDTAAARAAQDSIASSFPTDEKRRALWKVYSTTLVDYVEDAIFSQTPKTLSDERSTTPEDAEAKFVRVAGNAMYTLSQVIRTNLSDAGPEQSDIRGRIETTVRNKQLWEYSYHQDPSLRRAACSLALVCSQVLPSGLDWKVISSCFVGKALHSSQLGSSGRFSEAILSLTTTRPEIWTADYTSKTSAFKRLLQYLRRGSQRGSADFWTNTFHLLLKVPPELLFEANSVGASDLQATEALVEAVKEGISHADEPRQNLDTAWSVYIQISFWLMEKIDQEDAQSTFFSQHLLPLLLRHVFPDSQTISRAISPSTSAKISSTVLGELLRRSSRSLFATAWGQLCSKFVDNMKMSLPESSKDFIKSQDNVIAEVTRLFELKAVVVRTTTLDPTVQTYAKEVLQAEDKKLATAAIDILKSRNGKPYGAAFTLRDIASSDDSLETRNLSVKFLESDGLELLSSPSAEFLATLTFRLNQDLAPSISRLLSLDGNTFATKTIATLLKEISALEISKHEDLQTFILEKISRPTGDSHEQEIISTVFQNPQLRSSHFRQLCEDRLLEHLSPQTAPALQHATLGLLTHLLTNTTQKPQTFLEQFDSSLLFSKVLVLSDSDNTETAELATTLMSKLKKLPSSSNSVAESVTTVVADQLSGKGIPLSIFALIDLAKDTLKDRSPDKFGSELLPSESQWKSALAPHLSMRRPRCLTITSPLHGLLYLVDDGPAARSSDVLRDADDFSLLFRLVLYSTRLLRESEILTRLSDMDLQTLYTFYVLSLQLVNEKMTMESANDIWLNTNQEVVDEVADTLSQGNALIQQWIVDDKLIKSWMQRIRSVTDLTPYSYLQGLAFADVASRFVDSHGPSLILADFEREIKDLYRSPELIRSASLISSCRDQLLGSTQGRRLVNELVAACTDVKASNDSVSSMRSLVLLDLLVNSDPEPLEAIPNQRMVFLMQSLVRLLDPSSADLPLQTLALKLLDPVLAITRDIYGEHWEQMFGYLAAVWDEERDLEDDLPMIHASLRLHGRLETLAKGDDSNEDLSDAYKVAEASLERGLLRCLQNFRVSDAHLNQPRRITAELLRRQLAQVSVPHDPSLYSLLSSTEDAVRRAAYDLLHRSIPKAQEQISIDIALEKKDAHLPEELLSLLANGPRTQDAGGMIRQSYLLQWRLAFDHFTNASYRLQEMYMADIKESGVIINLLDLICEICRITSGRPLDASKIDLTNFEYGHAESDEQEEQRLSIHLYYCCLFYLPSLTRSWFVEQKNRVKSPLESWTQKYFSPSLVLAASSTVTEWAANQSQDESEAAVSVKTSLSGSEIVASIAIDPESPPIAIAISLPPTYPLDAPTVESRTRVGVSERNWQSWLRTFQIIIFSSGSIIEGLIALRRNVQGALKGQSECAICYSIIGTDMQTPNKRCGTCRNTFHGACLFRWFKSSNSSSCPLCRNNFNYA